MLKYIYLPEMINKKNSEVHILFLKNVFFFLNLFQLLMQFNIHFGLFPFFASLLSENHKICRRQLFSYLEAGHGGVVRLRKLHP